MAAGANAIAEPNRFSGQRSGSLGAEPELSGEARMVQESVHRYAAEVMRPIGVKLDRMSPEQAIAPNSRYCEAKEKFLELGFGVEGLFSLEPEERAETMCILLEELGWGDSVLRSRLARGCFRHS
jgi:acyl-CoA dehydrogenase